MSYSCFLFSISMLLRLVVQSCSGSIWQCKDTQKQQLKVESLWFQDFYCIFCFIEIFFGFNVCNCSRFGKFVELQFDERGRISGAAIRTYLLERSRVCQVSDPERNYHCFYMLCAGPAEVNQLAIVYYFFLWDKLSTVLKYFFCLQITFSKYNFSQEFILFLN